MDKVPMTAEGYAALEAEIKHLKTVERPRIIKLIADARTHGDLSENAEYHAAKEQQGITEARMADLEDKLSRADIIDVSKLKGDQVMFGATVTLVDEDTDEKAKYRIVGEVEADVKQGQDLDHLAAGPRACSASARRTSSRCRRRAAASPTRCSRSSSNRRRSLPGFGATNPQRRIARRNASDARAFRLERRASAGLSSHHGVESLSSKATSRRDAGADRRGVLRHALPLAYGLTNGTAAWSGSAWVCRHATLPRGDCARRPVERLETC